MSISMNVPSSAGDQTSLEKLSQEPRLIKREILERISLLILLRADFEGVWRTRNGDNKKLRSEFQFPDTLVPRADDYQKVIQMRHEDILGRDDEIRE